MAEKKYYTRKKVIDGVEYTAQFNGISAYVDAVDECHVSVDGTTTTMGWGKLNRYILEKVIVEPAGLTMDDFESLETMSEVVRFGREVMQGKFRDSKDEGAAKK